MRHERRGRVLVQVPSPRVVTAATNDANITPLNNSPTVTTEQPVINNNAKKKKLMTLKLPPAVHAWPIVARYTV